METETKTETKETNEDEWGEVWLDKLVDFKLEPPHFEFNTFVEKSEKLKMAFNEVNNYVQRFGEEVRNERRNWRGETKGIKDCSEINNSITFLEGKRQELIEKARKVLGSIYEGQLIKGHLTTRRGNFFYFRRRYEMKFCNILDEIIEHKEEVVGKLDGEQQELLAYVFNFATDIGLKPHKGDDSDYHSILKAKRTFPMISMTVPNERRYSNSNISLSDYNIDGFEVGSYGLKFLSGEETVDIYDFVDKYLIENNKDLILEAKNELREVISKEKAKLEAYENEINNKFAKVLVWRKFRDEKGDN